MAPTQENKWKVESAVNTLIEAEKIKKDKPLMRAVKTQMQEQTQATNTANKVAQRMFPSRKSRR